MNSPRRVLIDTWYAAAFEDVGVPLNRLIQERCPRWLAGLAQRAGIVRGLLTFWLGRSYSLIVTTNHTSGWWVLLLLEAWLGRGSGRIVLLEFIRTPAPSSRWRQIVYPFWLSAAIKPALRRALRAAHVLTSWESDHYARMYDIPREKFHFVPYPQRWEGDEFPNSANTTDRMVLSSGRAACDWEMLFKAAEEREWPLTVICGKQDLERVQQLNRGERARVLCEVPWDEHEQYVQRAALYVLCLREDQISSGQVRVMSAIRAGTPIIATRVKGLEGYLVHDETAVLVEPGDHVGLRDAVEQLLANPDARRRLAQTAFQLAGQRTVEQYLAQIRRLVLSNLDGGGSGHSH